MRFNCGEASMRHWLDFLQHRIFGAVRLKNYSKLVTKTRNVLKANAAKQEDTKQDIEIKLLGG